MKARTRRVLLFGLLLSAPAFAENKVVADSPRWRVAKTAHFDLHYTADEAALLPMVSRWSEEAYARLTKSMDVVPADRVSLFIFATHNRFEQNNVADVGEGTGGVTEAFKNRIVLYNDGTQAWMDHVITHEFMHVLQFEALYGGFWKSARLLKSPLYPLWAMEGMAEYGINDIDRPEEDLYLRDAALDRALYSLTELHGFNHLKPHQVTLGYKSGTSFMRFLAREYGPDVPARLLKGMRDRFDATGVVADLTRQDFRALDERWREYLSDHYAAQVARLKLREPETYGRRLTAPDFLPAFNEKPALSPDGKKVAFVTDRNGPPEVAVADLDTGVTRFVAGRQWSSLEHVHSDGRALSFSPDGRWLAFSGEREQRDSLYLYDLKRDRLRRVRTPFEQVRSPIFHPTEEKLVIVGMKDGLNDLYEVTPRGKVLRRLTRTLEDENDPAWSPDGKSLVFSREVPAAGGYERDLAMMDLDTLRVRPLTDMPRNETSPAWTPDGKSLLFVGEALEGVRNLYRLDLAEGKAALLTRAIGGNFGPDVSRDGKRAVFSSFRHNSHQVYLAGPELWTGGEPAFSGQPSAKTGPADQKAPPPLDAIGRSPIFMDTVPYRFRASTDLFFPVLYYSSQDGLFVATLWQASEHMGNHTVQGSAQYGSGEDFLDYSVQYAYKRFRPQFVLGASGRTFFRDFERIEQRVERARTVGVSYPLDRFRRLETFLSAVHREDRLRDPFNLSFVERENTASASFVRETATGRYLSVTDGSRLRLTQTEARPVWRGTRNYHATQVEAHRFLPTGGQSTLAFRTIVGDSTGPSPQFFRIGGGDRLRGYPRNGVENQSSRYAIGNLEWRVPLKYFEGGVALFPEIAFKALFGTLFVDAGYDGTREDRMALGVRRRRTSVGAGLSLPSFVLQTYPIVLKMDVARRTDKPDWTWYFALGPEF